MAKAEWGIVDASVHVWITATFEYVTDPIHAWLEVLLENRPFIVQDFDWESWDQRVADVNGLLTAQLRDGKEREVLYGGTHSAVLGRLDSQGWISGLRVFVLETAEEMRRLLAECDGKRPDFVDHMDPTVFRFRLGILADAACSVMTPGKVSAEELLQAAEETARAGLRMVAAPAVRSGRGSRKSAG